MREYWKSNVQCFRTYSTVLIVRVHVLMSLCVHMCGDALGGQSHWIPLELNSQGVVNSLAWVLSIKLGSSIGAVPTPHRWAIYLVSLFLNR